MSQQEIDIPMSGEQTMKVSKLFSLCKEYIIDPLRNLTKSTTYAAPVNGKQKYADVIVRNAKGEVLLLQRSYQDETGAGQWCLPGGHVDEGENSQQAAKRELLEETGLSVDFVRYVDTREKDNCIIDYYEVIVAEPRYSEETSLLAAPTAIILDNEEHYRYQWVHLIDLKNYSMIFDLSTYIEDLLLKTTPIAISIPPKLEDVIWKQWLDSDNDLEHYFSIVRKAFDEDQLTPEQYIVAHNKYIALKKSNAIAIVQCGFNEGLVSEEKYIAVMTKCGLFAE